MTLAAKSLDRPDEVRTFERGSMALVELDGHSLGRVVFEPGWRWSQHVKPNAGTPSCEVRHVGYVLQGRMVVRTDDGAEAVAGPGDAFVIGPGHDGWTLGNEDCVILDWGGSETYAAR